MILIKNFKIHRPKIFNFYFKKHLIEESNGFMSYWDIKKKLRRILGIIVSEKTVAKHGHKILGINYFKFFN
jgi:hypothetical protein